MLNLVLINVSLKPGIDEFSHWLNEMRLFAVAAFLLGVLAVASALVTPSLEDESAPKDYEQFGKLPNSFKFHEFATTYWQASKICRAEGAQLTSVESKTKLSILQQLFARFPEGQIKGKPDSQMWVWVGIHERGEDKDFRTADGVALSANGFPRWKSGYPKLPGASDCGVIERGSSLLADDICEKRYPFVCEYTPRDIDISSHIRSAVRKRIVPKEQQMMAPSETTVGVVAQPGELAEEQPVGSEDDFELKLPGSTMELEVKAVGSSVELKEKPVKPTVDVEMKPVEAEVELVAEVEPMLET